MRKAQKRIAGRERRTEPIENINFEIEYTKHALRVADRHCEARHFETQRREIKWRVKVSFGDCFCCIAKHLVRLNVLIEFIRRLFP